MLNFKQWIINESRGIRLPPDIIKTIDDNLDYIVQKGTKLQNFNVNIGPFKNQIQTDIEKQKLSKYNKTYGNFIPESLIQALTPLLDNAPNQIINISGKFFPEKLTFNWQNLKHNFQFFSGATGWAGRQQNLPPNKNPAFQKDLSKIIQISKQEYNKLLQQKTENKELLEILNSYDNFYKNLIVHIVEPFYQIKVCDIAVNKYKMFRAKKEEIRSLLIHELIHCMDIAIMNQDDNISRYENKKLQKSTQGQLGDFAYYDRKAEVEAHIGQITQGILDIAQKSTDHIQAKEMLDKIASQLRNPNLINLDKDENNPLVRYKYKFAVYYQELDDKRKILLLKRLDRALQDAYNILKNDIILNPLRL